MPKYNTLKELQEADFPSHVEFPPEYFPDGVGPGGFDPYIMYLHSLAIQKGAMHEYPIKSWVVLWLLDHVDWEKVTETHKTEWKEPNNV